MQIRARVENRRDSHQVTLTGFGSSANGGELLALALATCSCNDLYREAATRRITVHSVEVEVDAEFGGPGEPARQLRYRVKVSADASEEGIRELVTQTDRVAEVHNTLRTGLAVELER